MLAEALARVAELQDAIRQIDDALEGARLTWLRSTPTDEIDHVYSVGCDQLNAMRIALQGELATVRMGAML